MCLDKTKVYYNFSSFISLQSLQAVEETLFPECPKYSDIFNDTSIHSFPLTKLETFPKDLWQLLEEPQYEECGDLEIIRSLTI